MTQSYQEFYQNLFPFWDQLSYEEQQAFCQNSLEKHFTKQEMIHSGREKCTGAIAVKTGCLRVYLLSEEGREITLYRLYPGDVCMLSASCVLSSLAFDVLVDAEEESDCCIINGPALARFSEQNMIVKNYVLEMAVRRFSDVMWVMQRILFLSFDRRLAIFLCDEMDKTKSTQIHLTHEQIARYTGSAREVVSRMLKYFENESMVSLFRGGIQILDPKKLRELAD